MNLKGNAADAAIFSIQRDRRGRLRIQAACVEEIGTERFRDPFQHLSQIFLSGKFRGIEIAFLLKIRV